VVVGALDVLFLDTGGTMVGEEYGAPLKAAGRFLRGLIRACPTLTVVVLVHMVKPPRDAKAQPATRRPPTDGMGQWTRQADVVANLTDLGADRYRWELAKRRGVPKSAGIIDYSSGLATWVADAEGAAEVITAGDSIRVLRAIAAGANDYRQVMGGLGMSKTKVYKAIGTLRNDGLIGDATPYAVTDAGGEALS